MSFLSNVFRKTIKIKYHNNLMPELIQEKNKRIDLRVNNVYVFLNEHVKDKHGDIHTIPGNDKIKLDWERDENGLEFVEICHSKKIEFDLGISVEMHQGYEAEVTPRSGLYQKHGLTLTNSLGVIDNEYKGNNDVWKCKCEKAFFSRIYRCERLFQFKIVKNMEMFNLKEVKHLGNDNRGGYGSTGRF